MKVAIMVLTAMLAFVNFSYGFDIDGFKDGMKKEIVLEKIKSWNFDRITEDETNYISAYDLPEKNTIRHYNFSLKDNKLVSVQKDYKPSMTNYILLFKELVAKNGEKVSCYPESRLSTNGEEKSIRCIWIKDGEQAHISYNIFPANDQLSVFYSAFDKYTKKKK